MVDKQHAAGNARLLLCFSSENHCSNSNKGFINYNFTGYAILLLKLQLPPNGDPKIPTANSIQIRIITRSSAVSSITLGLMLFTFLKTSSAISPVPKSKPPAIKKSETFQCTLSVYCCAINGKSNSTVAINKKATNLLMTELLG